MAKLRNILNESKIKSGESMKDFIKKEFTPEEIDRMKSVFIDNKPIDLFSSDEIGQSLYEKWYDVYMEEMPYGISKARTGDPDEFIINQLVHFTDSIEAAAKEVGLVKEKAVNKQQIVRETAGLNSLQILRNSPDFIDMSQEDFVEAMSLVKKWSDGETNDLPKDLYEKLYNYYSEEMPYGTAKARTGDPYAWISDKVGELFSDKPSYGPGSGQGGWNEGVNEKAERVEKTAESIMESYIRKIVRDTIKEIK